MYILVPWFCPAYKAGGPIQSIANMVELMEEEPTEFNILCSNKDQDGVVLEKIVPDTWVTYSSNANVWYSSVNDIIPQLTKQIKVNKDAAIYINGIFDWNYNFKPIVYNKKIKKIISPRGMLQKGALEVKPFKKKIYLHLLKFLGLLNNVKWHATNEEEKNDIQKYFPKNKGIVIAPNIPKKPVHLLRSSSKIQGNLRLVYLSLITEKKNLHLILEGLMDANLQSIVLDIYGPVKDKEYWEKRCLPLLSNMENRFSYKGDVSPGVVQSTLANYDAMILLTKGENFGHALYENFSVGRPVITSYFTPWNDLEEKRAGWNVDIKNKNSIIELSQRLILMSNEEHQLFCEGAYELAKEYYYTNNFKKDYNELFRLS